MSSQDETLHVTPVGDGWTVEKENGTTVGQEVGKEPAVRLAQATAEAEGASQIAVHTEDGLVEKMLRTEPPGAQEL
jgi:hypothetical protein